MQENLTLREVILLCATLADAIALSDTVLPLLLSQSVATDRTKKCINNQYLPTYTFLI